MDRPSGAARAFLATLGLIVIMQARAAAPQPALLPNYSIDQTQYFSSPEAEQADLQATLAAASEFPASAPPEPSALLDYIHRAENLLATLQRHEAFLNLRASRDIDDRADADGSDSASDAITALQATAASALRALGADRFNADAVRVPALNPYAYLVTRAERQAQHELPKEQQVIVDALADPSQSNLWTLYQKTLRSTQFARVTTSAGDFDVRKDSAVLSENPDRAIREAAWQRRWDGYATQADVYAGILLGVVRLNDRVAHLLHFPDAPTKVYFDRDLDRTQVTASIDAVERQAQTYKRYQRLRANHTAVMQAIADVRPWDLTLPAPGFHPPRMTFDETRTAALAALTPLGPKYVELFRQLLNPANRRLDVAAEQGKRTNGGFSVHAPGVPTGLFVDQYGLGLLGESKVIIHEGGHAIHGQLMNDNSVSPFYSHGPNWMSEAFATLNELLLYDYLYSKNTDAEAKAFYLSALIGDITFQLFGSAEEGALEQSIYDGVTGGQIKTAADLDALTLSILNRFEIWPAVEPRLAHTWMVKSLMVQDPLYLVNYLYSGLIATKMFDMVKRDPSFSKRYTDLLSHGFYAPPQELLHTFFGRDISQQQLVDDGMRILETRIDELDRLYRNIEGSRPVLPPPNR